MIIRMGYTRDWYEEQERQQRYFDEQDKRDLIQEEIDAEAEKIKSFEKAILEDVPADMPDTSREILKSYVAAHSTLTEKQRAYSLAMWVLNRKGR